MSEEESTLSKQEINEIMADSEDSFLDNKKATIFEKPMEMKKKSNRGRKPKTTSNDFSAFPKEDVVEKPIKKARKKAESIVAALVLEPCILVINTSKEGSSESDYDVEAIPGFFDPKRKRFFRIDMKPVEMENFNEVFKDFAEEKLQSIKTQKRSNQENIE